MRKILLFTIVFAALFLVRAGFVLAKTPTPLPDLTPTETATPSATPTEAIIVQPKVDITQKSEESIGPLERLLKTQSLGPVWPSNPLKYALRAAVEAGIPVNTIILLLLLPGVAAIIAATRHLIGIRGFGIFLPAALSVSLVAIGPFLGIGLFLVIILVLTLTRFFFRTTKIKLQYLPRMALVLLLVVMAVLGVLFLAPVIKIPYLTNVSIFPVLILVLLAEEFNRIELGKSEEVAVNLTFETLILSLVSYVFLTLNPVREFVLLNPEIYILGVFVFNILIGKYVGLRLMEIWRFRKLINNK